MATLPGDQPSAKLLLQFTHETGRKLERIARAVRKHLGRPPALHAEQREYHAEIRNVDTNIFRANLRTRRGENGVERYEKEAADIATVISDSQIFLDETDKALAKRDVVGIRCLARFQDGKPSESAKKLYELGRREQAFEKAATVKNAAAAVIQEKYPTAASYYTWPLEKSWLTKAYEKMAGSARQSSPDRPTRLGGLLQRNVRGRAYELPP